MSRISGGTVWWKSPSTGLARGSAGQPVGPTKRSYKVCYVNYARYAINTILNPTIAISMLLEFGSMKMGLENLTE